MTGADHERARSPDLGAFAAITDAVEAGAGLPEILRAAARALDASLILIDRSAAVLAVAAARSPADERSLMRDTDDVTTIELKVADAPVGRLRMRTRRGHSRWSAAAVGDHADRFRGRARASARTRFGGGRHRLSTRRAIAADRGPQRA